MLTMAEVSLVETIQMITETPARIMGVSDRKGSLAKGKDADVVILNDQIEVQKTLVKGRLVYQKD
jgi:N-acetylglucosamine-6-phosphate deacetylase